MSEHRLDTAANAGTITVGDRSVHRLGFGAMRITGAGIWGEPPDRASACEVLRRAVELGVTFIDTADSYGPEVSEELIAEALHPYPAELLIATKGGLERPGPGKWTANGHPDHLKAAAEGSLRRLRLEQLPLYQLHRPDPNVPFQESVGALAELRREGKVRHVGLSNVTLAQLATAQSMLPIVSVQNRYNLADRSSEGLVTRCQTDELAFLPWAPMQDLAAVPGVAAVAARHGVTDRQVALAWLLAHSPAILPIPGTGSVPHLEDNVAAAGIQLDERDLATLEG